MYLSIDVGGTKILLASFSDTGEMQKQLKFPTPKEYPAFIEQLSVSIKELCNGQRPMLCAVGLPGALNRETGVAEYFGNLDWANVPIRDDIQQATDCPVLIENDAKLAGLAEAYELRDSYSRVLYLTISTGIGISLVVNGKLDYSVHDAGGKAMMMEHDGKIMAWEEFASGKAIVAQTGKMASEITDEGDWYLVARNIAIGLVDLIVTLSPDCVVIGGGVGTHLDKFHGKLLEEIEIYRSKMISRIPVVMKAKNPEEAVVYGGYLLCRQHDT